MTHSELIGYVRKSNNKDALVISLNVEAFNQAEKYETQDGNEYVRMVVRMDALHDIENGVKDVTCVTQIIQD